MIEFINQTGASWVQYFGLMILQNTIFLMIVFLALAALKNSSAQVKYIVGMTGIIKLLLPPFLPFDFNALFSSPEPAALAKIEAGQSAAMPVSGTSVASLDTPGLLFIAWIAVALLYLLLAFGFTVILRLKLDAAKPVPRNIQQKSDLKLIQTQLVSTPLSIGLFPRHVILPSFFNSLPQQCQQVLINHELAHIRRKDGFFQLLQILAQAVYVFHPLVWLLNERVNEWREMACDDTAIQQAKLSPMQYSRYLVHMAEKVVHPHWSYSSATALIRQKNKLTNRVDYLLKEAAMKRSSPKTVGTVMVLLALLVVPLSLYSSKPDEPVEPNPELNVPEPVGPPEEPAVPDEQDSIFVKYDQPPEPIGGFAAIQKNLRYPEVARKAGIEGRVYVNVHVGKDGQVRETRILKSLGENNGCDEAAVAAIKAIKWKPARYQGKVVDVWVGIPVVFKLKKDNGKATSQEPDNTRGIKNTKKAASKVDIRDRSEIMKNNRIPEKLVAYDTPPSPVGGFKELQRLLVYPDRARQEGIEGSVYVNVLINEKGEVEEAKILKSLGDDDCDQSAIAAIRKVKWEPAKKNGQPVKVWVAIPVAFRLK